MLSSQFGSWKSKMRWPVCLAFGKMLLGTLPHGAQAPSGTTWMAWHPGKLEDQGQACSVIGTAFKGI